MNNLLKNCTTVVIHEHGREIRMIVPRAIHLTAIGTYFQSAIFRYFRMLEERFRDIEYLIDVGAHCGLWTIPYTCIFPRAKILAIEPSKYNYPLLCRNVEPYRPSIETLKLALGNETGEVEISSPTILQKPKHSQKDTGLISMYGLSDKWREVVPIDKLDNIISDRVDLIKIDTEGAEIPILLGAEKTIMRDRPILQVEMREINQEMAKHSIWQLLRLIGEEYKYISIGEIRGDLIFMPKEYCEDFAD